MFRTATGQTGTDAYIYESAAIANARRELDARAAQLAETIIRESPADPPITMSIASKRFPDATTEGVASPRFIRMCGIAADAEYLGEIARAIADPDYILRH